MSSDQRTTRIFGILFLITFITSITALALYQPVLDDPAWELSLGSYAAVWGITRDAPILWDRNSSHQQVAATGEAV